MMKRMTEIEIRMTRMEVILVVAVLLIVLRAGLVFVMKGSSHDDDSTPAAWTDGGLEIPNGARIDFGAGASDFIVESDPERTLVIGHDWTPDAGYRVWCWASGSVLLTATDAGTQFLRCASFE